MNYSSKKRIAVLGNYFPRKCGIATFTSDLCAALAEYYGNDCDILPIVMNDTIDGYDYPEIVKSEIFERSIADYKKAAQYINTCGAEVLCVQHEYGIYGGKWGGYLLLLLREVKIPVVTVLHTVIEEYFDPFQENIFKEILSLSSSVIVMNKLAIDILSGQGIPREKIFYIPHGTPDFTFESSDKFKGMFGLENRTTILTFGLIRKCKGIEVMIKAMRGIAGKYKDVLYIIAGQTHPNVLRGQGERYRDKLISMTKKYGLEDNIMFINRYLALSDLIRYLYAADFYVIPYQVARQIVSGTLSYAVASGKAVITTPMKCAEEYIQNGVVRSVPFNNYRRFASNICRLIHNNEEMLDLRKRAYNYGRDMTWEKISSKYMDIFNSVVRGFVRSNI
jgi:glycosyltransferase involved in cell wall biosynthesis